MLNFKGKIMALAKKDKQALYAATRQADWAVWRQYAASHDLKGELGIRDIGGNCLLEAAHHGHVAFCNFLRDDLCISITYQSANKSSVLTRALAGRQLHIIDWLRERSTSEEWQELMHSPCYAAATLSGDLSLTARMREYGATPYERSGGVYTPAYCAMLSGNPEMIAETLTLAPDLKKAALYKQLFAAGNSNRAVFGHYVRLSTEEIFEGLKTLVSLDVGTLEDPDNITRNPVYLIPKQWQKNASKGFGLPFLIHLLNSGTAYCSDKISDVYGRSGQYVHSEQLFHRFMPIWEQFARGQDTFIDIDALRVQLRELGDDKYQIMAPLIDGLEADYVAETDFDNSLDEQGLYRALAFG